MNLLFLPDEVLVHLLIILPINSLSNLSQTNSRLATLTNKEYVWQNRAINELPNYVDRKSEDENWKTFYLSMLIGRSIPITNQLDDISFDKSIAIYINITPLISLKELTDNIIN